jgi:hypothetical protein
MWRLFASAAVGSLLGAATLAILFHRSQPANLEECVLRKMEGRTDKMIEFVYRACQAQYPPAQPANAFDMFDDLVPKENGG